MTLIEKIARIPIISLLKGYIHHGLTYGNTTIKTSYYFSSCRVSDTGKEYDMKTGLNSLN